MAILENATKSAEGVSLNGVVLSPVVEQCAGCERIREFDDQQFCSTYPNPERKWAGGRCNFSTHIKT
ncbi:MAG: PxxKW family cysteine-rich protein, partial [Desulfovibrionaceae bacterium]